MRSHKKAYCQLKTKQMREYYDTHSIEDFIAHYAISFCELLDKLNKCENKCRRNKVSGLSLVAAEKNVKCLEEIIRKNGIKPQRLLVRYVAASCKGCPNYSPLDDECPRAYECEGHFVDKVEEIALYCMNVDEYGFLEGITTDFEKASFEAVEIIDANTGKTLWEGEQ